MTDREKARVLRDEGLTYEQIGNALGVSKATAYRWIHPDHEEHSRRVSLAWKHRNKTSCPECGQPVDVSRPGELCGDCKYDREHGAWRIRITEAWNRGEDATEIAAREGISLDHLCSQVSTWRQSGANRYPEPVRRQLPHGDTAERYALLTELWNADLSAYEIVDQIGTTNRQALWQMVQTARAAGYDLKVRKASPRDPTEVVKLWNEGLSGQEIADRLGIKRVSLFSYVHSLRQRGYDLPRRR